MGAPPVTPAVCRSGGGITLTQGVWQSALVKSLSTFASGLSLFNLGNSFYLYDRCN